MSRAGTGTKIRPFAVALAATVTVALSAVFATTVVAEPSVEAATAVKTPQAITVPDQPAYTLTGLNETVGGAAAWSAGIARQEAAAAEKKAHEARDSVRQTTTSHASGGTTIPLGGPCEASKPSGFPDSIIWRESRGDPNAVNGNGGARGCAQIMPSHFGHWPDGSPGACLGLGYDECWSKLWAGGAGAAHWACTPQSGCG